MKIDEDPQAAQYEEWLLWRWRPGDALKEAEYQGRCGRACSIVRPSSQLLGSIT